MAINGQTAGGLEKFTGTAEARRLAGKVPKGLLIGNQYEAEIGRLYPIPDGTVGAIIIPFINGLGYYYPEKAFVGFTNGKANGSTNYHIRPKGTNWFIVTLSGDPNDGGRYGIMYLAEPPTEEQT